MGRHAVRRDLKRKAETFSIGPREMALVRWYEDHYDMGKSQALRAIFDRAESTLDGSERESLSQLRQVLTAEARELAAPVNGNQTPTSCPKCHDKDGIVERPNGEWRCDFCGARSG